MRRSNCDSNLHILSGQKKWRRSCLCRCCGCCCLQTTWQMNNCGVSNFAPPAQSTDGADEPDAGNANVFGCALRARSVPHCAPHMPLGRSLSLRRNLNHAFSLHWNSSLVGVQILDQGYYPDDLFILKLYIGPLNIRIAVGESCY